MTLRLYDYARSSACYRVRIALNLKGLDYQTIDVSLIDGAQKLPDHLARNPQGFVPVLEIGAVRLTQSLAIIEWLDATYPEPRLIAAEPNARAAAMAIAQMIACDIHPVNNLRVLRYLTGHLRIDEAQRDEWYRHWICEGFTALETMANGGAPFFGGLQPGIADICLVPQMANARRFATPLDAFPTLVRIDDNCRRIDAFSQAHPDAGMETKS